MIKVQRERDLFAGMNGIERKYATLLEAEKRQGLVREWWYEGVTFVLGDGSRFTPDFVVVMPDGEMKVVEVKGPIFREAARVRLLVFARLWPFQVTMVQFTKAGVATIDFTDPQFR